jgi:hypothetical protein
MHRFLPMFYKPEVAHNGRTDISPQSVATDCASGADTPLKMRSVRASFGYATVTCAALGYQTRGRRYEFFLRRSSISYKVAGASRAESCRGATTVLTSFCNERVSLLTRPRDERRSVMNESHFTNAVAGHT